MKTDVACWRNS